MSVYTEFKPSELISCGYFYLAKTASIGVFGLFACFWPRVFVGQLGRRSRKLMNLRASPGMIHHAGALGPSALITKSFYRPAAAGPEQM